MNATTSPIESPREWRKFNMPMTTMSTKQIRLKSLRTELKWARKWAKTLPQYVETVAQLERLIGIETNSGTFNLYSQKP